MFCVFLLPFSDSDSLRLIFSLFHYGILIFIIISFFFFYISLSCPLFSLLISYLLMFLLHVFLFFPTVIFHFYLFPYLFVLLPKLITGTLQQTHTHFQLNYAFWQDLSSLCTLQLSKGVFKHSLSIPYPNCIKPEERLNAP